MVKIKQIFYIVLEKVIRTTKNTLKGSWRSPMVQVRQVTRSRYREGFLGEM